MDIVRFEPNESKGAGRALPASSIANFFDAADAKSAKQACRKKGALLHASGYDVEEGDLLELARAGGALVFSFSDILPESGFRRAILLSRMRLALEACRRRGTSFAVCSLAKNENELRSARELSAFASVLGMTDVERKEAEKKLESLTCGSTKPKNGMPADSAAQVGK